MSTPYKYFLLLDNFFVVQYNFNIKYPPGFSGESECLMKKVLVLLALVAALVLCLVSCSHIHNFGEWSVTKNATCTEDGVKTRYCDCGEKQSDVMPATGHSYIDSVCINCGDVKESLECKHENLDILSAKEPTCTETGLTEGIICLDCEKTIKQQETVNVLGHDEYTYTEKDENCKLFTVIACNRIDCDYIRRIDTGKLEHTHSGVVTENTIPATCYSEGSYETVVYCADCSIELERAKHTVPMVSHAPASAVDENVIDSTCFAEGKKDLVVYCSVSECHKELERNIVAIDKKQHTPANAVEENRIEPTYEADGSYEMVVYCSVGKCHAELERTKHTIDMLVHNPGSVVIENNVSATCTKSGSYDEVVYCLDDYCGHKELSRKTITVEKLPHTKSTAVKENELSAKCYAEGSYDEVVYCSVCKTELSRNKVTLAKVEHIPANAVIENRVEASCTVYGSYNEVVYCSVSECKAELSRTTKTIPAKGHTPGAGATCTTEQICTKCLEIVTPALGHNWGEWENIPFADGYEGCICESEILQVRYCMTCLIEDEWFNTAPAPGHDWKDATCTEPKTCQRTGCKVTDGEPKGHNFGEWITVKEGTTKEEGLKERTCFCGYKETEMIPIVQAYIRDGDYIYFGEYPQTIKADSVTITSYIDSRGYYLGSDGYYYAMISANPFSKDNTYKFSTGKTITDGKIYYFKVEPIRWRILSEENGEAFLLCDSVIAKLGFDSASNNYADSDIRAWLNATFYETAFTSLQQTIILTTEVDNSVESTAYENNPYACENTSDKIFLLSFAEITNSSYGFSSDKKEADVARRMLCSDYAKATGVAVNLNYGSANWWLRSPSIEYWYRGSLVSTNGVYSVTIVHDTCYGVVPALKITL